MATSKTFNLASDIVSSIAGGHGRRPEDAIWPGGDDLKKQSTPVSESYNKASVLRLYDKVKLKMISK